MSMFTGSQNKALADLIFWKICPDNGPELIADASVHLEEWEDTTGLNGVALYSPTVEGEYSGRYWVVAPEINGGEGPSDYCIFDEPTGAYAHFNDVVKAMKSHQEHKRK
ncbi:hypothetical protein HO291_003503 [Salmonella enterica]|nr:hypothetical protein [Salmonella enterica]